MEVFHGQPRFVGLNHHLSQEILKKKHNSKHRLKKITFTREDNSFVTQEFYEGPLSILLDSNSPSVHTMEHPVTMICLWKENKISRRLTASTSAGSYHTLMYGCCKASSTDILFAGSITSIFDNKSLAWLAETMNEKKIVMF